MKKTLVSIVIGVVVCITMVMVVMVVKKQWDANIEQQTEDYYKEALIQKYEENGLEVWNLDWEDEENFTVYYVDGYGEYRIFAMNGSDNYKDYPDSRSGLELSAAKAKAVVYNGD